LGFADSRACYRTDNPASQESISPASRSSRRRQAQPPASLPARRADRRRVSCQRAKQSGCPRDACRSARRAAPELRRSRTHFPACRRLLSSFVGLVGFLGNRACQQSGVGLDRDSICIASVQPRQRNARREEPWGALQKHQAHRRVHQLERARRSGKAIGPAMRIPLAGRALCVICRAAFEGSSPSAAMTHQAVPRPGQPRSRRLGEGDRTESQPLIHGPGSLPAAARTRQSPRACRCVFRSTNAPRAEPAARDGDRFVDAALVKSTPRICTPRSARVSKRYGPAYEQRAPEQHATAALRLFIHRGSPRRAGSRWPRSPMQRSTQSPRSCSGSRPLRSSPANHAAPDTCRFPIPGRS
jgi:hypothetical protein